MRTLALTLALGLATSSAQAQPVLLELWRGLGGDQVTDLTGAPAYTTGADEARQLDEASYENLGSNYGARLSTLVVAPVTGAYSFYLAADDGAELWLSDNAEPAGLKRIAAVAGYSDPLAFEQQAGQRSAPIELVAGRTYLLRALHKQGGGGNHLAVAWRPPGTQGPLVLESTVLRRPALSPELTALVAATVESDRERVRLRADVERAMAAGDTLPVRFAVRLESNLEPPPANDTGINVLVDQSHQTQFVVLWGLRGELRGQGFRAASSVASLDTVLRPGARSRIRLPLDELEPFAWWPTARWNVVLTSQQDLRAQPYTTSEIDALERWVRAGGGLLVLGGRPGDAAAAADWSLNALLARFDAACTELAEPTPAGNVARLRLGDDWTVLATGDNDGPVRARRAFGQGYVQILESQAVINIRGEDSDEQKAAKRALLTETITALAAGSEPVGGSGRLPAAGGVGIFPELAKRAGNVIVYYAANQPANVRELIDRDLEPAAAQVVKWLPTVMADEPYAIVLCGGGGGGWAINPRPKAAAVIEYQPLSILGVFGHEMAHTLTGPGNDEGQIAGNIPIGNQGEAHAGWFQGKLAALFSGETDVANRNANTYTRDEEKAGRQLDLATEYETAGARENFGYGTQWTKVWYIWQKLDDRYGPTWYPRWYWVRSTRWADEPGHRETFDEMVETMSIAVGEDLFPFFNALGTSGLRERLPEATFQGQTLTLPVAPLDLSPAGPVNLEPIGDYRQPVTPR